MKKAINLFILVATFTLMLNVSYAVRPTYSLVAKNFNFPVPNQMVFDIYITCTNTADTVLQFSLGQYYFNFDSTFCAGGTISYDFAPSAAGDSSDFQFAARPRNPSRLLNQLRVNSNVALGNGNGPIVPGSPGKKIIRMRLSTTAAAFASNNPIDSKLVWRNANAGNPFTKIFAYVGNLTTEITDSLGHSMDTTYFPPSTNVSLILKVIIEGLYYPFFNQMARKDSVKVYLRSAISPFEVIDSARGIIDSITYNSNYTFVNLPAGLYYIVVKNNKCIETWSKAGGESLIAGISQIYDFTTSISKAYGNNLKQKGSKYCLYSGDVDQDGIIDASDLSRVENDKTTGLSGYSASDLNGDEYVDATDLSIVMNNKSEGIFIISP